MTDKLLVRINELEATIKEGNSEMIAEIKNLKREFRGLIEIQQRLIHERLGVSAPAPPKEYGEDEKKKKNKNNIDINDYTGSVTIRGYSGALISVSGNTFDYNSAIKSVRTRKWEPTSKSWLLSVDCLNELIENFVGLDLEQGKDFTVNVTKPTEDAEDTKATEEGGFGEGFSEV